MRFAALLLVAISACSNATSVASHPNAAASQRASAPRTQPSQAVTPPNSVSGAYAVVVKDFLEGGATYTVTLVATDGHLAAAATPRKRSRFVQIGNLSTSATTLYYLDGDTDIHYLRPDGRTGLATAVTLAANQVATFSVSPDDKRIAVAVLDFTKYPVGTRLYVEDLVGHANHVELFSSPAVEEWPVGWHGGHLVMALGPNAPPQNEYEGFLRGHGYHVADALTGTRLLDLCPGADSPVPESPGGTVCVVYPNVSVVSWDAATWSAPKDGNSAMWGPLAPGGLLMATRITATPCSGCRSDSGVFLVDARGVAYPQPNLPREAAPEGWIDATHLLLAADLAPNGLSVVDTTTGQVAAVPNATGFFAAALPGGL